MCLQRKKNTYFLFWYFIGREELKLSQQQRNLFSSYFLLEHRPSLPGVVIYRSIYYIIMLFAIIYSFFFLSLYVRIQLCLVTADTLPIVTRSERHFLCVKSQSEHLFFFFNNILFLPVRTPHRLCILYDFIVIVETQSNRVSSFCTMRTKSSG